MKVFKPLLVTLLFLIPAFAGSVPVSDAHEPTPAEIQNLKDAAAALKDSNPDLSVKLANYVDQASGGGEWEEAADIQWVREAAVILKLSNPRLSAALTVFAQKETAEMAEAGY